MKRMLCLLLFGGLVALGGCAQEKPEAAARKIFERQVQSAAHAGLRMDVSDLDYDIVEQGDGRALVEVTGLMPVRATIPLVQERGKWVLDPSAQASPAEKPAAAH